MMNPGDRGIDIARYQHPGGAAIDYRAVAASGIKFVYVELTDGAQYQNTYCATDARGFQAVGVETGAYQFYEPTDDADNQTGDFIKLYQSIGGWTLPIMIDSEKTDAGGWATLAKKLGDFRSNLMTATGDPVGAYIDIDFYDNLPGCPWGWDIWLADPSHPTAPSKPCLLQQTGAGNVPGITGLVDLDIWRTPYSTTPVPPPVPPSPEENDTVTSLQTSTQLHVWGIIGTSAYHWWQDIGTPTWHVEPLPA